MIIRAPSRGGDLNFCCDLVMKNWGPVAADRCAEQFVDGFNDTPSAPMFFIAALDDGSPIGFSALQPLMTMKGAFAFIWIAVHDQYKAGRVGTALTECRIAEVRKRDGQMIELVTQKPGYFSRFGFFKLHHLGNEWYLMLKLLKTVDI